MGCPSCGHDNDDGAKFCSECGTALPTTTACASCGAELADGAKFCSECGTAVGAATPAADPMRDQLRRYIPDELLGKLESARAGRRMSGERRTVTMVFCDLEGSTAAAGELDPEDWADVINGAFEHLISPVYAYEGTLARLMGDAILAFFGAPIAHEDDPERAVLAALAILDRIPPYAEQVRERWGIDLAVRIGIHTGLVVVGEMGSDLRLEYTAMGDAVNLAARMEQTAEAGTIQISDDTHRQVAPLFDTEDLGLVEVKGKAEPIHTHRVLGRKEAPGLLRGIEGLTSPMVGRDPQLAELRTAVDEVEGGRGAIVSVMAEAGLGKSRLVRELKASLEAEGRVGPITADHPAPVRWEEGRCQSYTSGTPYTPFIDLFSSCFALAELDDDLARSERVHEVVAATLGERADDVAPYVATMLGLPVRPDDAGRIAALLPPELRSKVFDAVAALVTALASERPLTIVLEDLHWADSTSVELLGHLAPIVDEAMLLLVAVFRPRREDPSWDFHELASRQHHHRYRAVELHPLPEADGRALVGNLLRVEGLPESVRALIIDKADGNPFFVEEVVRSLIDSGAVERDGDTWRATRRIDDVKVPETLAALITTRLDRLDDTTKLVTSTAAVIGRSFTRSLLEVVLDDGISVGAALGDLERRELIRETARLPEPTYRFTHALTQQTAYDSALVRTRRDLHRRLAEHLEAIAPDDVADLARHWMGADEPVVAIPYLAEAGTRAFGAYAIPEAISYLRTATEHICPDCATDAGRQAYEVLAQALTFSGDIAGADEAAQRLIDFGTERDDAPSRVAGLNRMAFAQLFAGADHSVMENLEQACAIATEAGDEAGLAEAHMTYCFVKTNQGMLESALANQQESMRLGTAMNSPHSRAFGLVHYANTLLYLTRYEEAEEATAKAIAFTEETGQTHFLAELRGHTEPFLLHRQGRFAEALERGLAATEEAAGVGAVTEWALCTYTTGQTQMTLGRWDAALGSMQLTLELATGAGLGFLATVATSALAVIHHHLGDLAAVERLSVETVERFDMPVGKAMMAACYAELGMCSLQLGDLDLARSRLETGLEVQSAASLMMEPMLKALLGLVSLQQGDPEAAGRLIGEATSIADGKGMRHLQPLAAMAAAQLSVVGGDLDGGLATLAAAEGDARSMGMLPMAQMLAAGQAQVLAGAGRDDAAAAAADRAADTVRQIAAELDDPEIASAYTATSLATT